MTLLGRTRDATEPAQGRGQASPVKLLGRSRDATEPAQGAAGACGRTRRREGGATVHPVHPLEPLPRQACVIPVWFQFDPSRRASVTSG
ncbi:hypothetical protein FAIPA1_150069 [Frankia sp. AiPs1]